MIKHRLLPVGVLTQTLAEAARRGRVAMTMGQYLALDFDPPCFLYDEEAISLGLDPWQLVEPEARAKHDGEGAYVGDVLYPAAYPVFVQLKDLLPCWPRRKE